MPAKATGAEVKRGGKKPSPPAKRSAVAPPKRSTTSKNATRKKPTKMGGIQKSKKSNTASTSVVRPPTLRDVSQVLESSLSFMLLSGSKNGNEQTVPKANIDPPPGSAPLVQPQHLENDILLCASFSGVPKEPNLSPLSQNWLRHTTPPSLNALEILKQFCCEIGSYCTQVHQKLSIEEKSTTSPSSSNQASSNISSKPPSITTVEPKKIPSETTMLFLELHKLLCAHFEFFCAWNAVSLDRLIAPSSAANCDDDDDDDDVCETKPNDESPSTIQEPIFEILALSEHVRSSLARLSDVPKKLLLSFFWKTAAGEYEPESVKDFAPTTTAPKPFPKSKRKQNSNSGLLSCLNRSELSFGSLLGLHPLFLFISWQLERKHIILDVTGPSTPFESFDLLFKHARCSPSSFLFLKSFYFQFALPCLYQWLVLRYPPSAWLPRILTESKKSGDPNLSKFFASFRFSPDLPSPPESLAEVVLFLKGNVPEAARNPLRQLPTSLSAVSAVSDDIVAVNLLDNNHVSVRDCLQQLNARPAVAQRRSYSLQQPSRLPPGGSTVITCKPPLVKSSNSPFSMNSVFPPPRAPVPKKALPKPGRRSCATVRRKPAPKRRGGCVGRRRRSFSSSSEEEDSSTASEEESSSSSDEEESSDDEDSSSSDEEENTSDESSSTDTTSSDDDKDDEILYDRERRKQPRREV